jgi:hypothetical protein
MRIFSGPSTRPRLERKKAWLCLLINALVCPGLGSLMARRLSGWPQLFLAWGGAAIMALAMGQYFLAYVRLLQSPPGWRAYLDTGLTGLWIFLGGWLWSVVTGILLFRQARPPAEPPPQLPAEPGPFHPGPL